MIRNKFLVILLLVSFLTILGCDNLNKSNYIDGGANSVVFFMGYEKRKSN